MFPEIPVHCHDLHLQNINFNLVLHMKVFFRQRMCLVTFRKRETYFQLNLLSVTVQIILYHRLTYL